MAVSGLCGFPMYGIARGGDAGCGISAILYIGLSVYRCVAAGVKPKTTARERCDGARVRRNPSYGVGLLLRSARTVLENTIVMRLSAEPYASEVEHHL